jgi:hypothetical protein
MSYFSVCPACCTFREADSECGLLVMSDCPDTAHLITECDEAPGARMHEICRSARMAAASSDSAFTGCPRLV